MALGTQWRGQRDTQSKRFGLLLLASFFGHLPFTPLAALLGLLALSPTEEGPTVDLGELTAIPVALLIDDPGVTQPETAPPSQETTEQTNATVIEQPPLPEPATEDPPPHSDAGVDSAEVDAGMFDAGAADSGAADSGAADGGSDAGAGGEPMAIAEAPGGVVDSNANVRLQLHNARIRRHPLGPKLGELLGMIYQWRDFFGPTGLDAIRDFDLTMVTGPQLRDSSKVAAIMLYNLEDARVHAAVEALVERGSGGHWLDAGSPAAVARADRAERTFILLPEDNVVMVVPPSAAAHALTLRSLPIPAPTGDWVADCYVVTPWRVFMHTRFEFPKSVAWATARVSALPDGSVAAEVVLKDSSAAAAEENAARLESAVNALTQLDLGVVGALLGARKHRFIEPVQFSFHGDTVRATVRATQAQLENLIEMAHSFLTPEGRRARPRSRKPAAATSASTLAHSVPDAGTPTNGVVSVDAGAGAAVP